MRGRFLNALIADDAFAIVPLAAILLVALWL